MLTNPSGSKPKHRSPSAAGSPRGAQGSSSVAPSPSRDWRLWVLARRFHASVSWSQVMLSDTPSFQLLPGLLPRRVPVCVPGNGCPSPFILRSCCLRGGSWTCLFLSPPASRSLELFFHAVKRQQSSSRITEVLLCCGSVVAPRPGPCPALCRAACPGLLGASCANLSVALGSYCRAGIPSVAFKKLDLIKGH